jgi:Chaperone of endosialidase
MRLKDNIKKIDNVYSKTKSIEGVSFTWDSEHTKIKDNKSIQVQAAFKGEAIGVIAQQVENIVPEVVFTDDDGYKSVEYGAMVSLGFGSIQEQQKIIDSIYQRINKLKELIGG